MHPAAYLIVVPLGVVLPPSTTSDGYKVKQLKYVVGL